MWTDRQTYGQTDMTQLIEMLTSLCERAPNLTCIQHRLRFGPLSYHCFAGGDIIEACRVN
jgi:hypothetical protein